MCLLNLIKNSLYAQDREYSLPVQAAAEVALLGALVFGGQGVQLTFPETPPGW